MELPYMTAPKGNTFSTSLAKKPRMSGPVASKESSTVVIGASIDNPKPRSTHDHSAVSDCKRGGRTGRERSRHCRTASTVINFRAQFIFASGAKNQQRLAGSRAERIANGFGVTVQPLA